MFYKIKEQETTEIDEFVFVPKLFLTITHRFCYFFLLKVKMASNGESPALAGMTCEEVTMKALGEWGRWQMSLIGCLILFRAILLGALSAIVFLGAPQPFACLKPPADPGSCVHCDQWSHETKLFRATVVTESLDVTDRADKYILPIHRVVL
ncbi:hypothetical protein AAG570_008739 [Ranatra chinensis]|uniref:Uncharacterized protein n=1 Tax=Ranatra chinensis TaxID=642074 RepID=A0ABD0YRV4_9HEMI